MDKSGHIGSSWVGLRRRETVRERKKKSWNPGARFQPRTEPRRAAGLASRSMLSQLVPGQPQPARHVGQRRGRRHGRGRADRDPGAAHPRSLRAPAEGAFSQQGPRPRPEAAPAPRAPHCAGRQRHSLADLRRRPTAFHQQQRQLLSTCFQPVRKHD